MNWVWAVILSAAPFGELRAGIPLAVASGVSPWTAFGICVIANILIVPFIFLFLDFVHVRLLHLNKYKSGFDFIANHTKNKTHSRISKYGYIGLYLLTSIPFPMTGAWTAALAAWFFGMNKKKAFCSIGLGVFTAGLIMLGISYGGLSLFGFI